MTIKTIKRRVGFNPLEIYYIKVLNDWACDDRLIPEDPRKQQLTEEEIEFVENYILADPDGWET